MLFQDCHLVIPIVLVLISVVNHVARVAEVQPVWVRLQEADVDITVTVFVFAVVVKERWITEPECGPSEHFAHLRLRHRLKLILNLNNGRVASVLRSSEVLGLAGIEDVDAPGPHELPVADTLVGLEKVLVAFYLAPCLEKVLVHHAAPVPRALRFSALLAELVQGLQQVLQDLPSFWVFLLAYHLVQRRDLVGNGEQDVRLPQQLSTLA